MKLIIEDHGIRVDALPAVVRVRTLVPGQAGEELSLWALTRLVARVRAKLAQAGYPRSIATVRGVGYRWG